MTRALLLSIVLSGCSQHDVDVLRVLDLAGNDLSTTDATPPPSLCTVANVALCDGFEASSVDRPPWDFVQYSATVELDKSRFYRGLQSLVVHSNAMPDNTGRRQGELTETPVVPQPDFFLRVFVYLSSPVPTHQFRLFGVLQQNGPNLGPQFVVNNGNLALATDTLNIPSTTPMPFARWTCVDWEVKSATTGEMHVWIDGTPVTGLDFAGNTQPSPPVGRFSFGTAFFGDTSVRPIYDVWFDEIALDANRIGCDR